MVGAFFMPIYQCSFALIALWHVQVEVLVTTAGGIEEDLIKCLAPTYKGDFALPGSYLRSKGLNRIGNLLVPNDNYCKFEDWIMPILDQMLLEQTTEVGLIILKFLLLYAPRLSFNQQTKPWHVSSWQVIHILIILIILQRFHASFCRHDCLLAVQLLELLISLSYHVGPDKIDARFDNGHVFPTIATI